jgi:hypothetical protein
MVIPTGKGRGRMAIKGYTKDKDPRSQFHGYRHNVSVFWKNE